MDVRSFVTSFSSYAAAITKRMRPICKKVWVTLNLNLVEGILVPRKYCAIAMQKGSVGLAFGEKFLNRNYLKKSKQYTLEEDEFVSPEKLASTLSIAMEELDGAGSQVLLGVPREWLVMRTIDLPAVVKENVQNAVAHEIDRVTPLNAADALYDFFVDRENGGRLSISLMAVQKHRLDPYVAVLRKAGLGPTRIFTPLTGVARICSDLVTEENIVFLHVGTHDYKGGFIRNGNLCRTFYGPLDLTGKIDDREGFFEEVRALIEQEANGDIPSLLCLISENETAKGIEAALGLSVREINQEDVLALFKTKEEAVPYSPAGMLYETLSAGNKRYDLAAGHSDDRERSPLLATLALTLVLLATIIPYFLVPIAMEKRRISQIDYQVRIRKNDIKNTQAVQANIDSLQSQIDQIQGFKDSRPMVLSILKELTSLLPKPTWLTRTRITEGIVEIEGYTPSATGVLSMLEQSGYFKKVEFASPTVRDTRLNAERFVVRMEMEISGKQIMEVERKDKKDEAEK